LQNAGEQRERFGDRVRSRAGGEPSRLPLRDGRGVDLAQRDVAERGGDVMVVDVGVGGASARR